jgi:RecA-family ATPase
MINRFWNGIIERAARRYGRPGPAETTERVVQERFTKPTGKPGKISSLDQLTSVWDSRNTLSWVIPDLLAEGSLNLLSAASGTGKTWFAYFLAGAVAHGNRVFGKEVQPRLVLYNDRENPLFVVKQRLSDLGIGRTPNLKIWGGWEEDPPPGPDHPLVRAAAKEGAFIIWDSLIRFNPGDEQSSTDTSEFMEHFRHLAHLGATILILHHTGKSVTSQDYRGSSDIPAAVDMAYKLEDARTKVIPTSMTSC